MGVYRKGVSLNLGIRLKHILSVLQSRIPQPFIRADIPTKVVVLYQEGVDYVIRPLRRVPLANSAAFAVYTIL